MMQIAQRPVRRDPTVPPPDRGAGSGQETRLLRVSIVMIGSEVRAGVNEQLLRGRTERGSDSNHRLTSHNAGYAFVNDLCEFMRQWRISPRSGCRQMARVICPRTAQQA
jgi:hypothetical protein